MPAQLHDIRQALRMVGMQVGEENGVDSTDRHADCDRRCVVPRPVSNCSFTAPHLFSSVPTWTMVPAPAWPL